MAEPVLFNPHAPADPAGKGLSACGVVVGSI
jgi:hypothetical protein